ncbi:hypothetical protein ABN36_18185 [Salmonella enterica subsp. enterica]|uniref:hypothetical protein n=1 Tax=Salmonella enterica TaxID=28901 RepID=UPI0009B0DA40|nr:hypothetical protein [Salmonella enterica]EBZ0015906.1 hypothetical protein [Salmonella enterica subsp. enterica serovar Suberu]ECH9540592.1 hypothetical protein [Salmonella enterica subsp. enterica]EGI6509408.1 hypothetical protein [Salmonella enterica subsp. enterica serovar Durham]EHW9667323.1 hypothetical protein [Salmonella enterica subsp. enterica serovar Agbeni]EIU1267253.1 hypothetical protein [Salmonella enterica subsp. enterica serovar Agbeni]
MRIVNREQFLLLPANTLFSKYKPMVFGDIAIKGDTTASGGDYYYQAIADAVYCASTDEMVKVLVAATAHGHEFNIDLECESRDGFYDADQLFAVWDKRDVEQLINRLKSCL